MDLPPWVRQLPSRIGPTAPIIVGVGLVAGASSLFILAQIHSTAHADQTGWYVAGICVLGLGVFFVAVGVLLGVVQWREAFSAPLEVTHDQDDPFCVQQRTDPPDLQLRIKVKNAGRVGLNHVRGKMSHKGGYAPHWMRMQHDNDPPWRRSIIDGEILPADDPDAIYFDVAFLHLARPHVVYLEYADPYLRTESAGDRAPYELTIRLTATRESDGRSVVPTTKHFRLELLDSGMRLMEVAAP
jgi:hypothetical protein